MIESRTEFYAVCDDCGDEYEQRDTDRSVLSSAIEMDGWVKDKIGRVFCPECKEPELLSEEDREPTEEDIYPQLKEG